ncbi:MAG TPA: GNAT family N-acetyltransferase [Gaiellaceae bacterium]|nr:GNAT family N-acetyltransferase [Gaiellaceae bacterium]
MTIRKADKTDLDLLRELWEEFQAEVPEVEHYRETWEEALPDVERYVAEDVALVAEDDGQAIGFALARPKNKRVGYLSDVYVRPDFRRRGVGRELLAAAVSALGSELLSLNVDVTNEEARTAYRRLGFRDESVHLIVEAERLQAAPKEPSRGTVYVQTDDEGAVEKAVTGFLRRSATTVSPPVNGWVAVDDDACDHDSDLQARLARELSYRMGVVLVLRLEESQVVRLITLDEGRIVDEYLSVPEFWGPLPPGDVIAMGINPTVVSRLTGADAASLRAVARTADSPADLPPAPELFAELASTLRVASAP